jgi:hypothetical protein
MNPELVITQDETTALMAAAGLKPVETITTFADRWFVIYGK